MANNVPMQYSGPDGYILAEGMLVAGLPPVVPRTLATDDPDEPFFIRTHHVFEIWFAQILQELEHVIARLKQRHVPEDQIPLATQHIHRVSAIFGILTSHLPLLETLLTTAFFDFRHELMGGSGYDSFRFREIEWMLGLFDSSLGDYVRTRHSHLPNAAFPRAAEELKAVGRYQENWEKVLAKTSEATQYDRALRDRKKYLGANPSLRNCVRGWLLNTPYPDPFGGKANQKFAEQFPERFRKQFEKSCKRDDLDSEKTRGALARFDAFMGRSECRAAVFILQFADQPLLAWPASLIEAVLELDEAFLTWRSRHIAMVSRVLGGGRVSTKGQEASGVLYLERTTPMRVFPEFWDARTFLLGNREAAETYTSKEWKSYRLAYELDILPDEQPTVDN